MTDKVAFHDEEYQFPQDDFMGDFQIEPPILEQPSEAVQTDQPEQTQLKNGLSQIWEGNKRVIIALGIAVVIIGGFAVSRIVHKFTDTAPDASTTTPTPAVVQQPALDPQILEQINNLKADESNNNVVVRQLQGQIQELTNALNQSRVQQQQLNQSMMVLLSQVQQLSAQVKMLTQPKPVAAPKTVAKVIAAVPPVTYQLRAVVPGRAWIVGSDGQSQSVAVGDLVSQYGNIQSIDADSGIVITTSGKTIKFQ